MNEIIFTFVTCALLGGNFLESKQELKYAPSDPIQVECTRIAQTTNQFSCLFKTSAGNFAESGSNKMAEIYSYIEEGKKRFFYSKTGSQIISLQGNKAFFQFSSLQDEFTGAKVCVGSAKEKK